jgi:hypothetical protein
MLALPQFLDFDLLGNRQRVLHLVLSRYRTAAA